MPLRRDQPRPDPETLALRALAHVVGDETLLPRFLALSGLDAASLKAGLGDPALLGGVLDFVLGDERLVMALAAAFAVAPEAFAAARRALPGGAPDA